MFGVVQGDGRRLPIRAGVMNAAYCIGAPSIVGLRPALAELARVVRPRGRVIVSGHHLARAAWSVGPGMGRAAGAAQTRTDQYVDEPTIVGPLVDVGDLLVIHVMPTFSGGIDDQSRGLSGH